MTRRSWSSPAAPRSSSNRRQTVELAPGVMAFFGRGRPTWTVHETLRKGFHADSPDPLPF